ncbi:hypothetical protein NDU88_003981 [Pleurodeles waltl]|uniref:Uncharacterized protein n=1 Tax=Pleurodeles waltl TaxID=8319 RepID=A0AAV7V010_PLEWA|nr:hypothetical protein NDU88_003981 [Pleurodeles waltl]
MPRDFILQLPPLCPSVLEYNRSSPGWHRAAAQSRSLAQAVYTGAAGTEVHKKLWATCVSPARRAAPPPPHRPKDSVVAPE